MTGGIYLKESIKLFGFKTGFSHWFKWSFTDPFKMFYWTYIITRPLCTYHGFFLCKPDCEHEKISGRRNIHRYRKEQWEKIQKELKTIVGSRDGICAYCGEEEGTETIDDPNWDTLEKWLVCKTCKEVLELQREAVFPLISTERSLEIGDRIAEISKETGKPIMSAGLVRNKEGKYDVSTITFTGEKDANND